MKSSLHNLNEVLTYILEGMYDAEKKIQKAIPELLQQATSTTLKNQMKKYAEASDDKRTKLKRIFGYLLSGPFKRKNSIVAEILKDMSRASTVTRSKRLRDVLLVSSIQSLNHLKETEYRSARDLSLQLTLKTVSELLDEILAEERATKNALKTLAVMDLNQKAT